MLLWISGRKTRLIGAKTGRNRRPTTPPTHGLETAFPRSIPALIRAPVAGRAGARASPVLPTHVPAAWARLLLWNSGVLTSDDVSTPF